VVKSQNDRTPGKCDARQSRIGHAANRFGRGLLWSGREPPASQFDGTHRSAATMSSHKCAMRCDMPRVTIPVMLDPLEMTYLRWLSRSSSDGHYPSLERPAGPRSLSPKIQTLIVVCERRPRG
jgi:hypothetical protein